MATISPLRSPKRTPDLPSRWRTGCGGASVSQTRRNLLFWFFSGRKWIYRAEIGGGRAMWAPQACPPPPGGGGGRACGPLAHPLRWIFAQVFFIFSRKILRKFSGRSEKFHFCKKTTPWQFCWKQRESGLVPFKSCKLESKTRAKEFGKVDTMETYQLPQA